MMGNRNELQGDLVDIRVRSLVHRIMRLVAVAFRFGCR